MDSDALRRIGEHRQKQPYARSERESNSSDASRMAQAFPKSSMVVFSWRIDVPGHRLRINPKTPDFREGETEEKWSAKTSTRLRAACV